MRFVVYAFWPAAFCGLCVLADGTCGVLAFRPARDLACSLCELLHIWRFVLLPNHLHFLFFAQEPGALTSIMVFHFGVSRAVKWVKFFGAFIFHRQGLRYICGVLFFQ